MAKKKAKANDDEQIGFHKGALSTLAKEREEMLKILTVDEAAYQGPEGTGSGFGGSSEAGSSSEEESREESEAD
jgi:hypothetical protein